MGKSTLLRQIAARAGGILIGPDDIPTHRAAEDEPQAITATAHKLARLIYTMLTKGTRVDERINDPDTYIVVSDLTRLECLVKPLRQSDSIRLKQFEFFFGAPDLIVVGCPGSVFSLATKLRARHSLKTPDALHLAAAIEASCEEFWTNDTRLDTAARDYLRTVTF
jgi:hypothetical protein